MTGTTSDDKEKSTSIMADIVNPPSGSIHFYLLMLSYDCNITTSA